MEAGDRADVTFALLKVGGTFNPVTVTRDLGIEPSISWAAGDLRGRRVMPNARWSIESDRGRPRDAAEHLRSLLDRLEPATAALRALAETPGTHLVVDVYWETSGMSGGPYYPAELLSRLGALGIDLTISIYGLWDDNS